MADFDEELRRQAAISSLLAQQPESQPLDTQTDEQVVAQPEVIQPDTQTDYHKLIDQAFDTKTDEQVTAQPDTTVYPTITQDQGQPDKKFDTVTDQQVVAPAPDMGERGAPIAPQPQVVDTPVDSKGIPLDEKPVPQPLDKGEAPAQLTQVERGQELTEPWHPAVKPNVPGFVESSQNAIVNPAAGVTPPAPKPAYPEEIVTPDEASGAKSVVNAPAAPAAAAVTPAPDQTQVTQPASNDDYNKLMDSFFPSAKPADTSASPVTGEFQPDTSGSTRLNARMNNPGALGLSAWEQKYGATPSGSFDTGHSFAQFPTKEAGAAAQFDLWRRSKQFNGQTLGNAITNWIGPGEHGEAEYISQATGIPLNQVIDEDFLRSPAGIKLMQAQAHYEGANVLTAEQWKRGQDWAYSGVAPTGDTSTTAAAPAAAKMPWDDWAKLSPVDQAAAEKEGQDFRTQQTSVLDKLNQSTPNPKQFWDKLQQPIEGVTDSQRQAYADNFKQEVTKYAQDFYGEKDPEKAFSRAVSDPGLEAYVSNVGRGLAGAVGQADIGIALAGKSIDRNRVDGFMNLVHPDSTGEGRAGFVKALTDIQDTRHRHDVFNEIYGALPQNTKDAIGDPASILDSIDHLANPEQQVALNKAIATKKAWVDQQLAGSPELRGTGADWWTTGTGENLFNTVAALVPGGVGAVVRTSTLGAQMYSANMDRIAKEHPDYSPEQVSEEASKSAFMTLAPQEAVLAASHGLTAPLLKWAGSLAEKPIVRFGIGGGVQVAAAGAGGALGQVGANVTENKPILQDVPQAAGSAAVQSLPFAVHGGIGALGHEPASTEPAAPLGEHGPPIESVPVDTGAEHGPPSDQRPVTRGEILGPDEPPAPEVARPLTAEDAAYNKWYPDKTVQPGQDPLVIRGAERTTWSPQELADLVDRAPTTPEGLKRFMEQVPAPASVHLGDEGTLEAEQTRQMRVNQPPITPTELLTRRAPVDLNTAIAQQRAAASLGGTPRVVGVDARGNTRTVQQGRSSARVTVREMLNAGGDSAVKAQQALDAGHGLDDPMPKPGEPAPPPVHVSESEPFTSKIANRYTAERMASGELGHIDPSQGKSTEELIGQGLKMSPEQRERMIDNFSRGVGGDLDNQGAAIRSKEALLSVQSTEAGRAAEADPTNTQLKANADAALKAATDFHNGPVKKLKRVWSDAGRGLQREIPLDYSTLNGMKEAYMKGQGNGKAAPPEMEPKLKETAARVNKSASDEEAAINNLGEEIGKRTRGKPLPDNDSIRAKLMKIMGDLPCRN